MKINKVDNYPRMSGDGLVVGGKELIRPWKFWLSVGSLTGIIIGGFAIAYFGLFSTESAPSENNAASVMVFNPLDDTFSSEEEPSKIYGLEGKLQSDGSPLNKIYLKFDLTNVTDVASATLRLYVSDSTNNAVGICALDDTSWSEATLTWENRPVCSGTDIATLSTPIVSKSWVQTDITSYVASNVGNIIGLEIHQDGDDKVAFKSKKDSSKAPELVITTSGSVNTPPTVSLESPGNNTNFSEGEAIMVQADATDLDGTIIKVDFYVDGTLLDTDTSSPYATLWNDATLGNHSLTAVATDNDSASTISSAISVTINPIGGDNDSTLNPTADTFVREDEPIKNYSSKEKVEADGVPVKIGYFKFDLMNITSVNSATLRLYVSNKTKNDVNICPTTTTWSETAMNWANHPSCTGSDIGTFFGPLNEASWIDMDVTNFVSTNTGELISFMMYFNGSDGVTINSRENAANQPELIVIPTVLENESPVVSLTSPNNGATYDEGDPITVTATASDTDGSVTKVDFLADGTLVGSDTTSPYSTVWNSASVGSHSLTAIATDNDLDTTTSTAVSITVNAIPTLSVALSASPSSGQVPLDVILSANVSGNTTGSINYSFWWNCNEAGTNVNAVEVLCGNLPASGTCNAVGCKYDSTLNDPQATSNRSYVLDGTYTGKVIAKRSTLVAEDRTTLTPSLASGFGPADLDGGGFQNVVAVSPHIPGSMILGGDVAGRHVSNNNGDTWHPANKGLSFDIRNLRIADVEYSRNPNTPETIYSGTGNGSVGGFWTSTDGGSSWTKLNSTVVFNAGNQNLPNSPDTHPRSTGNLIALDTNDSYIYVGTFEDGVYLSTDGGVTFVAVGNLFGKYIRTLVMDPSDANTLYAGTYSEGVWKTTNARLGVAATWSQMSGAPATAEEMVFVGMTGYAAAGAEGIWKLVGTTWSNVYVPTSEEITNSTKYESIAGHSGSPDDVIYASNVSPTSIGGVRRSIIKSTDSGSSWFQIPPDDSSTYIHDEIGGFGGPPWWKSANTTSHLISQSNFVGSQITIDPFDTDRIVIAGRSGVWRSENGGQDWYPIVDRLGVSLVLSVVADPNVPDRVYMGVTDWVFMVSTDGLDTVQENKPSAGYSSGHAVVAIDPSTTPSTVYIGQGHRDNNSNGDIFYSTDATTTNWIDTGFEAAMIGAFGEARRPIGLAIGQDDIGQTVIVAAVDDGGIWTKVGTNPWANVVLNTQTMGPQNSVHAPISWVWGTPYVYVYDRTDGIWRSDDYGAVGSWQKIWDKSDATYPLTNSGNSQGYIAADPSAVPAGSRLYVAAKLELYRLDDAHTGSIPSSTPVVISGISNPGVIAVEDSGRFLATDRPTSAINARFLYSDNQGVSWSDSTNEFYRSVGTLPYWLSIGSDGRIYMGLNGNAIIRSAALPPP